MRPPPPPTPAPGQPSLVPTAGSAPHSPIFLGQVLPPFTSLMRALVSAVKGPDFPSLRCCIFVSPKGP